MVVPPREFDNTHDVTESLLHTSRDLSKRRRARTRRRCPEFLIVESPTATLEFARSLLGVVIIGATLRVQQLMIHAEIFLLGSIQIYWRRRIIFHLLDDLIECLLGSNISICLIVVFLLFRNICVLQWIYDSVLEYCRYPQERNIV